MDENKTLAIIIPLVVAIVAATVIIVNISVNEREATKVTACVQSEGDWNNEDGNCSHKKDN